MTTLEHDLAALACLLVLALLFGWTIADTLGWLFDHDDDDAGGW